LAGRLAGDGIGTSVHFAPAHRLSRYRAARSGSGLPNTEQAARRLLSLPCYPAMTDDDVDRVIAAVRQAFARPEK
jgi:dTDP-4-amino-4,6-dideoxygalactose transaminase